MKRLASAITLLLASATVTARDWPAVLSTITDQVGRLELLLNGEPGVCSAVVINAEKGFALTAAHCVDHAPDATFDVTLNHRHADVVRVNRILDLAILRFERRGEKEMRLAADPPTLGAEIAIAGFAFGSEDLNMQFGHVSQPYTRATKTIWLNVDAVWGDSGAPVVNAAGELIGLMVEVYARGPAHLAGAVPGAVVREFAEVYLPSKSAPKGGL